MSDVLPNGTVGLVEADSEAMEVEEVDGGQAAKPGLSIAPVRMTSEIGEDGQKKVPGIKIIGLSSELKKAMAGEEGSVEDFEEDPEVDDESEEDEEEDEDEEAEEAEEYDESSVEATPVPTKTPKVTIRKVQQVTTPGSSSGKEDSTPAKVAFAGSASVSVKKRGRPSRADLALREQERQEALARGEPDPELKR